MKRLLILLALMGAGILYAQPQSTYVGGQVGPQILADGAKTELRMAKTRETVVADAHGKYYEASSRGRMYHACVQAGTALGTALTATAVTLTLYNPLNSGTWLAVQNVTLGTTAALNAAGNSTYVLAANVNPLAVIPATNTLATIRNNLLGGPAGVGIAYTATTLPAVPVIIRNLGSAHLVGATPVSESSSFYVDDTAGQIILTPNTAVTIQGIGTASSGIPCITWEEVPIS